MRVAIVGGGLGGLTCLHRLTQEGVEATLYEASAERVGGRVLSAVDAFGNGQVAELGASFVNGSDAELLSLVDEFGLRLKDLYVEYERTWYLESVYWFDGQPLGGGGEVIERLEPLISAVEAAAGQTNPWSTITWQNATPEEIAWDSDSIADRADAVGLDAGAQAVLRALCGGEYGAELDQISALNCFALFGVSDDAEFDERYKIDGGNDQVPRLLAERHAEKIEMGRALEALREASDGSYVLSFSGGVEVTADAVVLAIPFSVLREVSLDVALSPEKEAAIGQLSYGANAKLACPVTERFWKLMNYNGFTLTDQDFQLTWEATMMQGGLAGILTSLRGGDGGLALGEGRPESQRDAQFAKLEAFWPGASGYIAAAAPLRAHWPTEPYARGSYSGYSPGQWTAFGGAEATPAGGIFFAGEHTSPIFRGYMNGAAESGARAAGEVVELLTGRRARRRPVAAGPRTGRIARGKYRL